MAGGGSVVLDSEGKSFFLADDDDKVFAASHACVEEVALEEDILLHRDGEDDGRKFRALAFVDADGVGEREFVHFPEVVSDFLGVEADGGFEVF